MQKVTLAITQHEVFMMEKCKKIESIIKKNRPFFREQGGQTKAGILSGEIRWKSSGWAVLRGSAAAPRKKSTSLEKKIDIRGKEVHFVILAFLLVSKT